MSEMSKNWCFTWNNYPNDYKEKLAAYDVTYLVAGKEQAPTTGKQHLQGYVQFKKNMRMKAVSLLFPGAHIEKAKGNSKQNIQYCTKEDGDPYTIGTPPKSKGSGNKIRWDEAKKAACEGRFQDVPAELHWRFYNTMKQMAKDNMQKPEPLEGTCGLWIHGAPGTGKTHVVVTTYPNRYIKPINKWWDGYQQEEIVHIDELCPEHTTWITPYLKKWSDKWPFDAEVKGGALQIRPTRIIVTSNYSIDQMGFNMVDLQAIKRRFHEIEKTRDQNIII